MGFTVAIWASAVFQVFDGVQVSAMGALRGLKDTKTPMMLAMVSYWPVGLSAAYGLAFVLGWGEVGLWWGLVSGLGCAAILLTIRFIRLTAPGIFLNGEHIAEESKDR